MKSPQKALADEIATLVGGRASKNHKHILGEQRSEYRVTFHREPFWFTSRISEDEFSFDATHRRGSGERGSFSVTLFHPWPTMSTDVIQDVLSASVGIPVYGFDHSAGLLAAPILEAPEMRPFLRGLKEEEFRVFFLHDTQLHAMGPLQSPKSAASRMLMLREMMETVFNVSRIVNPHFA